MGYDQFACTANQTVIHLQAATPASVDRAELGRAVERLIEERRNRCAYFAASIFSDPAWDILLALALAESRFQRLTISKLCDAVDAPMTTALRWIGALTDMGLIVRRDDVNDKRRKFVNLSSQALAAMTAYCSRARAPLSIAA